MRKLLLYIVGGLVTIGILGLAVLPFVVDVNQYKGLIQTQLEDKLKRKVTLGNITLHRIPLSIQVDDLTISDDPSLGQTIPFAAAKSILVRPGVMALLRRQVEVSALTLEHPTIEVIRKADGTFNFSTLGGPKADSSSPQPSLSIDDLDLRNGTVAFTDLKTRQPRTVYDGIDLHLQNYAPGKDFKLYAAAHLSPVAAPEAGRPGQFDFQGTGRDSDVLKGKVTLKDVQISSLVKFLNQPGLEDSEGILNGAVNIDEGKENVAANGEIAMSNARVGKHSVDFPVALKFDASQNRAAAMVHIASMQAKLGDNSFGVTGDIDAKSTPAILHLKAANLKGSLTELAHIAALLGVASTPGLVVKGALDGDVAIDGPVDHPALTGRIEINNLQASAKEWKQPVTSPKVRLDFDPETMRAAPMELACGGSHLTARANIAGYAGNQPTIDADVKTNAATLEELLNIAAALGLSATAGMTGHGGASLDVHATGSAKNPNVTGLFALDNATLQLPSLAKPMSIAKLNLKFAQNSATIDNLAVNLGGSNITGNATLKNFDAPQITFNINADKLDLVQLQNVESKGRASSGPAKKATGPSAIDRITAKGTLSAGELVSEGLVLTQLKAGVAVDHGVASLAPMTATMFGGSVAGSIQADLRPATPAYRTTLKMNQVDANLLLSATTPVKKTVFGKLVTDGTLSFSGTSESTITRSLNGSLNLGLKEGRLMGVNMMNEVSKIGRFLGFPVTPDNFTRINALSGSLAITNGVAQASNLKLDTDGASVDGGGVINLVDQNLDLRLTAGLSKEMSDRVGGRGIGGLMVTALSGANGALVVPVHVTGPIGQPHVSPDAERFAQMKLQVLKNNPVGEIGGAVIGIFDQLKKKKPVDQK